MKSIVCGTFTTLKLNEPQPLPSCQKLNNEVLLQRKIHNRLRAKLRTKDYCLDASCIISLNEATYRAFGIVYSSIGREFIDLEVEFDNNNYKPLSVEVSRVFPLPFRLQSSGILTLQAFSNACEDIIIVFADRTGASMFAPYRSNFNEGCIWVTRYDLLGGLEVLSLTSRFYGRKPKDIIFFQNNLYLKVNDDDWISWSLCKEIDPIAEKHMRYIFTDVFGVSAQDCQGWLSPHASGELDKDYFDKLTSYHKPLFSVHTDLSPITDEPNEECFETLLDIDFDDFLPHWMQKDLANLV